EPSTHTIRAGLVSAATSSIQFLRAEFTFTSAEWAIDGRNGRTLNVPAARAPRQARPGQPSSIRRGSGPPLPSPVLDRHRPVLVILPAPGDAEVASPESFVAESRPSDERERRPIARDDVRLDAMKAQSHEGMTEDQCDGLRHEAPARERAADPVAEVAPLERAAHDLVQGDGPHDRARR